jgi:hypothetical protein
MTGKGLVQEKIFYLGLLNYGQFLKSTSQLAQRRAIMLILRNFPT